MALHAMAQRRKIGPLLNRIAKCRLGKSIFSVRVCVPVHRCFVDWVCYRIAYRLDGAKISDDRIEVLGNIAL
jgi:hypothetical protein